MRLNLKLLVVFLVLGLNLKLSANEISNNTLPTDPNVTHGTAEISQGANQLTIDQQTDKLITNWSSFNIGSDAKVQFNQPSSNSSALNHVNSADPSYIYGSLEANGKVILINPNGVIFSKGSRVDVGAIVASSLKLSDENFLKDNFVFEKDGIAGMIENRGTIKAFEGGTVALISSIVKNNGTIETPSGSTALLAGEKITLNLNYNQLISYTIDSGVLNSLVENNNAIVANNGQVILSARGLDAVRKSVVNNDGIIEAKGINTEGGKIFLEGDEITVKSNSTLNASGDNGGGQILVGGSWQNSDPTIYQATTTTIEEGATLNASANNTGNGGEIVVWSDITNDQSVTKVQGKLTAEGGKNSGNGGQIETSGYKLDVEGIEVSTLANDGSAGEWLLDPASITISTSGGTTLPNSTNSGNITSVRPNTILTGLASSNVTIYTGISGSTEYDIDINDSINYTGLNERTLTFKASGSIDTPNNDSSGNDIDITSSNAALNLIYWSDADGDGEGRVSIGDGDLTTNGGDLWIGGGDGSTTWNGHTVGDDYASTPGSQRYGVFFRAGGTINTGAGDIEIRGKNDNDRQYGAGITISETSDLIGNDVDDTSITSTGNISLYATDTINGTDDAALFVKSGSSINGNGGSSKTITIDLANGRPADFYGIITGTSNLTKTGATNLLLYGANTYTGTTTISEGKLRVYGTLSDSTDVINSGTYEVDTTDTINSLSGTGAVEIASGVTLTTGDEGRIYISGIISGDGSLTKAGSGTLTLSNNSNSYTGDTTVSEGTLTLTGNLSSSTDLIISPGATFDLQVSDTVTSLDLDGTISNSAGSSALTVSGTSDIGGNITTSGNQVYSGAISLTGNSILTSSSGAITLSSTVDGGSTLTTSSSGNLTTSGIIGGTTPLTSLSATAGGNISYVNNITTTGSISLNAEGNVDPNPSSGNITLTTTNSDVTLNADSEGNGTGTFYGNLIINPGSGNVTIRGATIANEIYQVNGTGTLTIESNAASFASNFTSNALTEASTLTGLTIGKSTNTSDITLNSDISVSGAVTVYGSTIDLHSDITSSGAGDITISASTEINDPDNTTRKDVTNSSGDIYLIADSDGAGLLRIGYLTLDAGSDDLILRGSTFNWGTDSNTIKPYINGTGGVTIESTGTAFGQGVDARLFYWNQDSNQISSLTIGKSTNTQNVGFSYEADYGDAATISVNGPIKAYTTGTGTVTLTANLVSASGTSLIQGELEGTGDFTQTTGTLQVNATGDNTSYTGDIKGGGAFTKLGDSVLALSGANTYTGDTTISAGTLTIDGSGTLEGGDYDGAISNSGTFIYSSTTDQTLAGVISGTGVLTKEENSTLTLTNANTYTGLTTVSAGTLTLDQASSTTGTVIKDTNAVTVNGGILNLADNTETIGALTLTAGSITGASKTLTGSSYTLNPGEGVSVSIQPILAGSGINLTKSAAGTATLSGANTYTGTTTISAGTLTVTGTLSDSTDVSNSGIYDVDAADIINRIRSLSGTGAVEIASGVTLTTGDDGDDIISGIISGDGSLTKVGSGTLTLSGNNTYTGATTVNVGTLKVTTNNALGTTAGSTTVASGATLDFANINYATTEAITVNGGTIATSSGTSIVAGVITLGAHSIFDIDGTQLTVSGNVTDGDGTYNITKTGDGILVLSNTTNSYDGTTTISAGTLTVTGRLDSGTYSANIINNSALIYNSASAQEFSGVVSGTGTLEKANASSTLTLSGTNTYSGATTISGGIIAISNAAGLGTTAGATTVDSGAALYISNE